MNHHDLIEYNDKDGYLQLFDSGVISNGFERDLYLNGDNEKEDDIILKAVDCQLTIQDISQ